MPLKLNEPNKMSEAGMNQQFNNECINLDNVKPSAQRIRNILTLEERVAAIQAYAVRPMYTKIAKMFNCSWEQIKNIIANRQAILEFYEATKGSVQQSNNPMLDDARKRKIEFLGECVYEYIQRLQYHNKVDITEELIRGKALEFRDIIRIDNFMPNKAWINQFKSNFNFLLSNRQVHLTRAPPSSLELRDIMTFCTKPKPQPRKVSEAAVVAVPTIEHNTQIYHRPLVMSNENVMAAEESRQARRRKMNFLGRTLLEYATRAKFHWKMLLDDQHLCVTAAKLRDILKVENFEPNLVWLKVFKENYNFDAVVQENLATSTRSPPLSLDLRDIVSYCSRLEKNSQIGAADNFKSNPKVLVPPPLPPPPLLALSSTVPTGNLPTVLGDFSVMKGSSTVHKFNGFNSTSPKIPKTNGGICSKETTAHKPNVQAVKPEIIDLSADQPTPSTPTSIKRTITVQSNSNIQHPMLKIRKIESMCVSPKEIVTEMQHSPGHWSEPSEKGADDDAEMQTLPKTVRSYADALKLLKSLEEFAMLEENYRAIGFIEQLEGVFKNPPSKEDDEEEEVDN